MEPTQTFGARFLEEWKRLGGPLSSWTYKEVQELRACEREDMAEILRRHSPMIGYAALQRIRNVESPEQLARELLFRFQAQAANTATMWMMIAMLS